MSQHVEAYALMWYACRCGHRERIWNSRDGVTPFGGLLCPSCNEKGLEGGLSHVEFYKDMPDPKHKLADGQRFFRDGTAGDAIAIIKNRIRICKEMGQPVPDAVAELLLEDARNQPRGEWSPGWPMSDRFDAGRKDHREKYWGEKS